MQTLEELILISVGANANSVGDDILSSRVGANACGARVGIVMNRIATISIIVEQNNKETVQKVNDLLHEFQDTVLGRMGIPDKAHGVNIISVAMCADEDKINALTGKLGKINGISAKTLYSKNSY